MARQKQEVVITQDEQKPIAPEVLATAIVDIQASMKKLLSSKLSKRALILLIQDNISHSKVSQHDIGLVLNSASTLADAYVRKD